MALLITSCIFMYPVFATIYTATGDPTSFSMAPYETNVGSPTVANFAIDTVADSDPTTALSKRMKNFLNFLDFRAKGRWVRHEQSAEVTAYLDENKPESLGTIQTEAGPLIKELSSEQIVIGIPYTSYIVPNTSQSNTLPDSPFLSYKEDNRTTTENSIKRLFKSIIRPFKKHPKYKFIRDTSNLKKEFYDFLEPVPILDSMAPDVGESLLESRHDLPRSLLRTGSPPKRLRHFPRRYLVSQRKYLPANELLTNGYQSMSNPEMAKEADLFTLIKKLSKGSIKNIDTGKPKSFRRISKKTHSQSSLTRTENKPNRSLSDAERLHLAVLLSKLMSKYDGSTTLKAISQSAKNPKVKSDDKVKSQDGIANFFVAENSWINVGATTVNYIEQDRIEHVVSKDSTPHYDKRNLPVTGILDEIMKHVSIALDAMTTSKNFIKFFDSAMLHSTSTEQMINEKSDEDLSALNTVDDVSIDKTYRTTCINTMYTDIDSSPAGRVQTGSSSTTNKDHTTSVVSSTLSSGNTDRTQTTTKKSKTPSTEQEDTSSLSEDDTLSTKNELSTLADFRSTTESWLAKMEKIIRTLPKGETDAECSVTPCDSYDFKSTPGKSSNHIEGILFENLKNLYMKIKHSQLTEKDLQSITVSAHSTTEKTHKTSTKLAKIKENAKVSTAGVGKKATTKANILTTSNLTRTGKVIEYGDYEIYDVTSPGKLRYDPLEYIDEVEDGHFMKATEAQPISIKCSMAKSTNGELKRPNTFSLHFKDTNDPSHYRPVKRLKIHLKKPNFLKSVWKDNPKKSAFDTELVQYRFPMTPYNLNTRCTLRDIEGNNILRWNLDENVRNHNKDVYTDNESEADFDGVRAKYLPETGNVADGKNRSLGELAGALIKVLKDKEELDKPLGSRMIPYPYQQVEPSWLPSDNYKEDMASAESAVHVDDKDVDQLIWLNDRNGPGRLANAPQSKSKQFEYLLSKPLIHR